MSDANTNSEDLYEGVLHTGHSGTPSLSQENEQYLQENDYEVDHVVTLDRIRRENGETYTQLVSAMNDEIDRKIFATLSQLHGRATYDDLAERMHFSKRSIKEHVYKLDKDGHIVRQSRPVIVMFADETTQLLAEDALNVFYDI